MRCRSAKQPCLRCAAVVNVAYVPQVSAQSRCRARPYGVSFDFVHGGALSLPQLGGAVRAVCTACRCLNALIVVVRGLGCAMALPVIEPEACRAFSAAAFSRSACAYGEYCNRWIATRWASTSSYSPFPVRRPCALICSSTFATSAPTSGRSRPGSAPLCTTWPIHWVAAVCCCC